MVERTKRIDIDEQTITVSPDVRIIGVNAGRKSECRFL
jgi:hypothetical protein